MSTGTRSASLIWQAPVLCISSQAAGSPWKGSRRRTERPAAAHQLWRLQASTHRSKAANSSSGGFPLYTNARAPAASAAGPRLCFSLRTIRHMPGAVSETRLRRSSSARPGDPQPRSKRSGPRRDTSARSSELSTASPTIHISGRLLSITPSANRTFGWLSATMTQSCPLGGRFCCIGSASCLARIRGLSAL